MAIFTCSMIDDMKQTSSIIYFTLAAAFGAITLWFVFNSVETAPPCSCSADQWKFGTLAEIIKRKNTINPSTECRDYFGEIEFGCVPSYNIFPTDTAAASVVLVLVGFYLRRKPRIIL